MAVAGATFIRIVLAFHSWSVRRRVFVASLGCLVFAAGLAPWVTTFRQHTGHYGVSSNGFRSVRDGLKGYAHFPLGVELQTRSERWATYSDIWADLRDVAPADLGGTLHLVGIRIVRPWYATWSGRWDGLLLALQLPWLLLLALVSGRAVWRWRRIPGGVLLLHGSVAAIWFTAFAVAPIFRYLSPAFPFVVLVIPWHTLDTLTPASVRGDAA